MGSVERQLARSSENRARRIVASERARAANTAATGGAAEPRPPLAPAAVGPPIGSRLCAGGATDAASGVDRLATIRRLPGAAARDDRSRCRAADALRAVATTKSVNEGGSCGHPAATMCDESLATGCWTGAKAGATCFPVRSHRVTSL